jgi:hypothetical protein
MCSKYGFWCNVELVVDEQILAPSMTCSSAMSHLNFLVFGILRTGPLTIDVGCVKVKLSFSSCFFWDAFVDVRLFCNLWSHVSGFQQIMNKKMKLQMVHPLNQNYKFGHW